MLGNVSICAYFNRREFENEFAHTMSKMIIEATSICSLKDYRAMARCGEYLFDFSCGNAIERDEIIKKIENDKLTVSFYELKYDMENPHLRHHLVEVAFIAKEDNGKENIAVGNSIYRSIAAKIFEAIDLFPESLIKDSWFCK